MHQKDKFKMMKLRSTRPKTSLQSLKKQNKTKFQNKNKLFKIKNTNPKKDKCTEKQEKLTPHNLFHLLRSKFNHHHFTKTKIPTNPHQSNLL